MLLHTRDHHLAKTSQAPYDADSVALYRKYATGSDARSPHTAVYRYDAAQERCIELVGGKSPSAGQEVVYADGGWDLFTAGHAEMLKSVKHDTGSNNEQQVGKEGRFVVVGLHDDATVNAAKGHSYPIMNMRERALSALACRVSYAHDNRLAPLTDLIAHRCSRPGRTVRHDPRAVEQIASLARGCLPRACTAV